MKKPLFRNCLFAILITGFHSAVAATPLLLRDGWSMNTADLKLVHSQSKSSGTVVFVEENKTPFTLISFDHPPSSIRSVEHDMDLLKITHQKIQTVKKKNATLFSFYHDRQAHWFSTRGGHLVLTADRALTASELEHWSQRFEPPTLGAKR